MIELNKNEIEYKKIIYKEFGYMIKTTKIKDIREKIKEYFKKIIIENIKNEEYINENYEFKTSNKIDLKPIKVKKEEWDKYKEEIEKIVGQEKYLMNEEGYYKKYKEEIIESKIASKFFTKDGELRIGKQIFEQNKIEEIGIKYKKQHEVYFNMIKKEDIGESEKIIEIIEKIINCNYLKTLKRKRINNRYIEFKTEEDYLIYKDMFEKGDYILIKSLGEHYIAYDFNKNEIEYSRVKGIGENDKIETDKIVERYKEFKGLEDNAERLLNNKINVRLFNGFIRECKKIREVYLLNKYKEDIEYISKILEI